MKPPSYLQVKRGIDIAVSACGLIATAPVQAVVAGFALQQQGKPVLFRQPRPGLNGEVFELVKFRTMRHPAYDDEPDEDRITPIGNFLRSTSLDELPTLWNVLKGDMSLVGPRPLMVNYLPLYSPKQARRHEVRPGVTGLAQVNGRNNQTWERRFELDVEYVDNMSFLLDAKILLQTVGKVLKRDGISAEGHVSMKPFTGSPAESDAQA